jgi:hypothetical protein
MLLLEELDKKANSLFQNADLNTRFEISKYRFKWS